ncbi:hypothetical protein FQN54_001978 [Arachnomyces sp. PD_36]|nr:hypothetical protein FQN54_001978 [Arachnomyces sp. PD_36]
MASNLRRLASDHADLHNSGLPPHYLFPPSTSLSGIPDDLTQLTILLTGPQGTPYSQGLWRLHLKIPTDYPTTPPKASFRTRIWHPNVDETTGAVCVDTLKRDWETKLTLRDVLITISCLLIHPNPDSALNSAAGALLQDDYEEFARQAKLMTSIHAPIPMDLKDAVRDAKQRGDDGNIYIHDENETDNRPLKARKAASAASVIMKKPATTQTTPSAPEPHSPHDDQEMTIFDDDDEDPDPSSESKENDPSLSPSLVTIAPPSPRRSVLGKRPLSVLATPSDSDIVMIDINDDDDEDDDGGNTDMTSSERNIAANNPQHQHQHSHSISFGGQRKSPKLSTSRERERSNNIHSILHHSNSSSSASASTSNSAKFSIPSDTNTNITTNIFSSLKPSPSFEVSRDEDVVDHTSTITNSFSKENHNRSTSSSSSTNRSGSGSGVGRPGILKQKQSSALTAASGRQTLSSKVTKPSSTLPSTARKISSASATKTKPRVGVRRL